MISKHLVTMFDAGALTLGALGGLGAVAFLAGLVWEISMVAGFLTGDFAAGAGLLVTGAEAGAGAEAEALAGAAALPGCFIKVPKTALGKRWNFKPPTTPTTLSSELKI